MFAGFLKIAGALRGNSRKKIFLTNHLGFRVTRDISQAKTLEFLLRIHQAEVRLS